ncbi:MAG: hypothetical protein RH942_12820 [Kiloniellaceae bacterium]
MIGLHITGASGSGTTSLGRALAEELGIDQFDTDDFFWKKTDPPYSAPRALEERLNLMRSAFSEAGSWILSGSIGEWGGPIEPLFDLVVFLSVPTKVRIDRITQRDRLRPDAARFLPGGDRHGSYRMFLNWASSYENGVAQGRNRALHEQWLSQLACPVLRLEGEMPLDRQVQDCLEAIRIHGL